MSNISDRKVFYKKVLVDDNLEVDLLDGVGIDFSKETIIPDTYTVHQYELGRMDLISYKVYGSVSYWWLIAARNNLVNIEDEMFVGQNLLIPSLIDLYNHYNTKVDTEEPITEVFDSRQL